MRTRNPPRAAQAFLRWSLPSGVPGASIKGDLDQEFRERQAKVPGGWHAGWYLREAFRIGGRFILARLLPTPGNPAKAGSKQAPGHPFGSLAGEIGRSFRLLSRNPYLLAFAVVAMGMGIGVTATMFSITHTVIQKLPYPDPEEIVSISWTNTATGWGRIGLSIQEFADGREAQSTLERMGAYQPSSMDLSDGTGNPEHLGVARISTGVFPSLGVQPVLGRNFLPEEEASERQDAAILSHSLWHRRYGEDPEILGRTIRLDGNERTVVGIMPEGFAFPEREGLWVPLPVDPTRQDTTISRSYAVLGRLKDGVSLPQAEAEFQTLARQWALDQPEAFENLALEVGSYRGYVLGPTATPMVLGLQAVISFVLLIACASVANLLLARAASRSRELAVQVALGASRRRIVGQILSEALVISAIGGILGVGIAYLGTALTRKGIEANPIPYAWMSIEVVPQVLIFTVGLVFVSSLLAGVVPGFRASGVEVCHVLKDQGRGSTGLRIGRMSRGLVVSEVALSLALLIVAGLMAKGPYTWTRSDLGFNKEGVFAGSINLGSVNYAAVEDLVRFREELRERLEAIPSVTHVTFSSSTPGLRASRYLFHLDETAVDREEDLPAARGVMVDRGFFRLLEVDPISGRGFSASDTRESPPVIILNQSFAARHFPQGNPLGQRIRIGGLATQSPWRTVVGVVPDLTVEGPPSREGSGFYLPLSQSPQRRFKILLRTSADPISLAPAVRRTVAGMDQDLPVYRENTLAREIQRRMIPEFVFSSLCVVSGVVALTLAAIGLFGILAFSVHTRTREIGIRMALGARSGKIVWETLRSGLLQVGLGLVIGLALAIPLALAMRELFTGTEPLDRAVWITVFLTLGTTGILASWVPAQWALRTDPSRALRYE